MFRIARDAQQGDGAENPYWWCDPNQVARDCLQKCIFVRFYFLCVLFWYLQESMLIFSGGIWLLSCTSHKGLVCKQRILNVTKNIVPINGQQQTRLGPEFTKKLSKVWLFIGCAQSDQKVLKTFPISRYAGHLINFIQEGTKVSSVLRLYPLGGTNQIPTFLGSWKIMSSWT